MTSKIHAFAFFGSMRRHRAAPALSSRRQMMQACTAHAPGACSSATKKAPEGALSSGGPPLHDSAQKDRMSCGSLHGRVVDGRRDAPSRLLRPALQRGPLQVGRAGRQRERQPGAAPRRAPVAARGSIPKSLPMMSVASAVRRARRRVPGMAVRETAIRWDSARRRGSGTSRGRGGLSRPGPRRPGRPFSRPFPARSPPASPSANGAGSRRHWRDPGAGAHRPGSCAPARDGT